MFKLKDKTVINVGSQYEEVCDMKDCEQILDINEQIHIWERNLWRHTDEITICDSCHQEFYDDLKSQGYSHDEEEFDE